IVAPVGQRGEDRLTGAQGNVALGGEATHEDTDLALTPHPPRETSGTTPVKKTALFPSPSSSTSTDEEGMGKLAQICGKDGRHDFPGGGPRDPSPRRPAAALQGADRARAREEAADVRRAHARGDDADAAHRGGQEGAGEPLCPHETRDLLPALP